MTSAYILEWLNLLIRWAHLITGIAWIGASFYFVWLDINLNCPPRDPENEDIDGDLWAIHGGGFYHAQKYKVAPKELPEPLHWFKWEAYFTWITGFLLLVIVFYFNAEIYLVDKSVADISGTQAIVISLGLLVAGWIIYDLLCKSPLGNGYAFPATGIILLSLAAYAVTHIFGGRGAFMQVGAMLGTIMAANVLVVIMPGQRELVNAKERGEEPDPMPGLKAKQRSLHNNYITLPVLFAMLSNHYPMTYGHEYNWLVLLIMFIVGGIIRHYFNLKNQGKNIIAIPITAVLIIIGLAVAIAPSKPEAISSTNSSTVSFAEVKTVIEQRCVTCHSANPTHPTAPMAPLNVELDTPEQIKQWAERIYERSVVTKTMPLANLTKITDEERDVLSRWFNNGASLE